MKNYQILSSEKGTTLIMFTIMIVAVLGFSALVADIGNVMIKKADMQADMDAIALAAAQDLPDTSKAGETAREYARLNGGTNELNSLPAYGVKLEH